MPKAVLISIRPEWCQKIASGEKTIEVRKTIPHMVPPFKCYIYQCLPKRGDWNVRDGHVIGEFVCDNVAKYWANSMGFSALSADSLVPARDLHAYAQPRDYLYGWHISDLNIYDEPKALRDFGLKRAPQSWQYVFI